MNYTKPEVVSAGRAVAMIESSQKDDLLPVDQSLDKTTISAYQADE